MTGDPGDATRALTPPATDAFPATIGQYRILGLLGRGGRGLVYEAEQARAAGTP